MARESKSSARGSVPVPPHMVRVFRGFKLGPLPQETFFEKLGSIFIPGTVQIQAPVGLTAYMPSVMPADHHASAPDEIALVFYEPGAYEGAKLTVAGRAYSDLHKLVFDMEKSFSGYPKLFAGEVEPDEKYYLFDREIDWQKGSVRAFVGVRKGQKRGAFTKAVAEFLSGVQSQKNGPDGAISVASTEHVVYWEHWPDQPGTSRIPKLAAQVEKVYDKKIPPFVLKEGVWDRYPGVGKIKGGETFNFQFKRRKEK